MKKLLSILIFVIAISQSAYAVEEPLTASFLISEENIQPGETFEFRMILENTGTNGITNIQYEVVGGPDLAGFPSGVTLLGGVATGSSVSHNIPVAVSGDASSGKHTLSFLIKYQLNSLDQTLVVSFDFDVGSNVLFRISDVTYEGGLLEPGQTSKTYVTLSNVGGDSAKDILATFSSSNTEVKSVLEGGTDFISSISSFQSGVLEFILEVESGTEAKVYDSEIELTYKDSKGNEYTEKLSLGLPVKGVPNLEVSNTELDNEDFKVEIENLGTAKAKAISVKLIQNGDLMGVKIDNELKPDKLSTLRFKNFRGGTGQLELHYLDDENQEYDETVYVEVPGRGTPLNTLTVLLLLLVAAETVYIYRKKKGKSRLPFTSSKKKA